MIDRKAEGFQFWKDEQTQDPAEWRRLGKRIRELVGGDPDIVFEHPGRSTMGASVFVCTRGGTIVTCAATSGFMIEYDNRYLWMNQKTLKGCHFANYREAWEANRLIGEGRIHPVLSAVFPFDEVAEAVNQVHHNLHEGKLGVLVLAPEEGLGVTDPELRERAPRPDHALSEESLMLTEIDHIAIAVNDLEAAIEYYRDTYGVEVEHVRSSSATASRRPC